MNINNSNNSNSNNYSCSKIKCSVNEFCGQVSWHMIIPGLYSCLGKTNCCFQASVGLFCYTSRDFGYLSTLRTINLHMGLLIFKTAAGVITGSTLKRDTSDASTLFPQYMLPILSNLVQFVPFKDDIDHDLLINLVWYQTRYACWHYSFIQPRS